MKLYIDTSDNRKTIVGLELSEKKDMLERSIEPRSGQIVLELTDELLTEHNVDIRDITEIQVHTGPGSFTGLRVGVAIANTLAYALHIPINGGKPGEPVEPVYT